MGGLALALTAAVVYIPSARTPFSSAGSPCAPPDSACAGMAFLCDTVSRTMHSFLARISLAWMCGRWFKAGGRPGAGVERERFGCSVGKTLSTSLAGRSQRPLGRRSDLVVTGGQHGRCNGAAPASGQAANWDFGP